MAEAVKNVKQKIKTSKKYKIKVSIGFLGKKKEYQFCHHASVEKNSVAKQQGRAKVSAWKTVSF